MNSIETAKLISADRKQLEKLNNADNFYVVLGNYPDDNGLHEFNRSISFGYWKLRGPSKGPYHLANSQNDRDFMHGFVYIIDDNDTDTFEKEITFAGVKTGYTAKKYSSKKEYKNLNKQHFNKLFEI